MQSAAQVLIHTTRTIDEIAEEFGYENESKFSAAFKKIMGDPPGVYRKEHSKVKIIWLVNRGVSFWSVPVFFLAVSV